ncbi:MAG TPA: MCP four helix bundle domain-containing protein [Verrucomicrobiae bacterium]|nr:MCP four helix bundle domain-containing protein [Verrucomicrobiae bacterium]
MSRRNFPARGLAAGLVLICLIGTAGFLSIEYLKNNARWIVYDTLAGLSDSSLANANLVEGFNRTVLALTSDSPTERERYVSESAAYNQQVNSSIAAYARSVFSAEDLANYNSLLRSRRVYMEVRKQTLALLDQREEAQARELFKTSLVPSYRVYKSTAERVMKYNADEGRERGEVIMQICSVTQVVIAGASIALFVLGFLLGLFK